MIRYVVYDVFTDTPFGGNQLAVFPDATGIADESLQKIAREFNFSEVTFVYPPQNPDHTAKVRIFTPTMEIPFAGHPTIGTAIALNDEGATGPMVLELGVGPIPCTIEGDTASFTTSAALDRFGTPDPTLIAQALGLSVDAIKSDVHPPVQAGLGLPFTITELTDAAQLASCKPSIDHFHQGAEHYPTPLDFAIFAYVRDDMHVQARMFAPLDNIPEDPATGSACAALAALLTEELGRDLSLDILQGEAMGRPSFIGAVTKRGDPAAVTISGKAVRVMQGQLVI